MNAVRISSDPMTPSKPRETDASGLAVNCEKNLDGCVQSK
jgi:hypothetical protein